MYFSLNGKSKKEKIKTSKTTPASSYPRWPRGGFTCFILVKQDLPL